MSDGPESHGGSGSGDPGPLRVEALSPDTREAFFRLHHPDHGEGWCFCAAWWVPTWERWGERTARQNREVRDRLFEAGTPDGVLLFDGGRPVGWCQVGPRDRLEKLVAQYSRPPDPSTWAVTCFVIAPSHRGRGLAHLLLSGALDHARVSGARTVEAFPIRRDRDLWTGPEPMFRRAGFEVLVDDASRPVLACSLVPRTLAPGAANFRSENSRNS